MNLHQVNTNDINHFKKADTSYLVVWYFKLLLRVKICSQNIWFFNNCIKSKITPNYIHIHTNFHTSTSARKAVSVAINRWLRSDRKIQYSKRDVLSVYLKVVHTELLHRLSNAEFDVLDFSTRIKVDSIVHQKYLTQNKKMKSFRSFNYNKLPSYNTTSDNNNQEFPSLNHKFYDRFVNLSNTSFSTEEENLLKKGFKFNFNTTNINQLKANMAVECEVILDNKRLLPEKLLRNVNKEKHFLSSCIKSADSTIMKNNFYTPIARKIRDKVRSEEVVITRADKGQTVVALSRVDYVSKTQDFLNSGSFSILMSDPTQTYQDEVKGLYKNHSILKNFPYYSIVQMNPQAPKLYSLIKLHKEDFPIRPVVSFNSSPSYKLSKKLINIINSKIAFKPSYSIKNSVELVNKLKNVKIPHNATLLSFDVKSLFPSIPVGETISILEKWLTMSKVDLTTKNSIVTILKTSTRHSYFQFNNNLYSSDDGLIMGDPISPLLAELFMDDFENRIMTHPFSKHLSFWFRYVDDVICCWTGTKRQLKIFHNFINNIHDNIKFTLETEIDNKINFLDLTISKLNDGSLNFSIFRKPTFTDIIIHNKSLHPYSHKMSTFYSLIHRLLSIPLLQSDYNHELTIIKQLALNNGYDPKMIDFLLAKIAYNKSIQEVFPTPKISQKYFHILTYTGKISDYIARTLRKYDLNISFRTDKNFQKIVKNNKDITTDDNKSGVYLKECGSEGCNKIYFGQTGRTFNFRNKEHLAAFNNNKPEKSNYAKHLLEEDHSYNTKMNIVHVCSKGSKLNFLEAMEINRFKNSTNLLNSQLDLNFSPLLNLNLR